MRAARILVVDDEPLVADTLGMIFRRRGFECEIAHSGEAALTRMLTFAPSLLLLDLHMPGGMNGLEVARAVAVLHPECRVLIMTGYYSRLREAHEYSNGLEKPLEFATKPVQPETLLQMATSMLATV